MQGQSESKKHAKRAGPETKGTAMSFGFKKKSANSKKNETKEKEQQQQQQHKQSSTVISNPGICGSGTEYKSSDDNGNTGNFCVFLEFFFF